MFDAFFSGLLLGGSLIMAIGSQNAFILKQGLTGTHIFATALAASVIDACLIGAGILGIGTLLQQIPSLIDWMKWVGALFLFGYGAIAFRNAFRHARIDTSTLTAQPKLRDTILMLLGFSLLNPHVYLDTVILIGSIGAHHGNPGRYCFGAGAAIMSFVWFFALAYGSRQLAPLFAKPCAWQILDVFIGITMWALAASLLL